LRALEKEGETQKKWLEGEKERAERQINKTSFVKLDFCGIHLQNLQFRAAV
jgi:hypothetical protein